MVELLEEDLEESGRMTIWEHLEELRKRILISLVAVVTGFAVCWFFRDPIFDIVQAPFLRFVSRGDKLSFISLTEPFLVYMKLAAVSSLVLTSPIIISQLWLFISPGLYKKERRYALPFIFFASLFFLSGCLFSYYFVFPFACRYFLSVGGAFKQQVRVDDYFSLFSQMILWIGVIFEIPILAFFLARFGIINHHFLISKLICAVSIDITNCIVTK